MTLKIYDGLKIFIPYLMYHKYRGLAYYDMKNVTCRLWFLRSYAIRNSLENNLHN